MSDDQSLGPSADGLVLSDSIDEQVEPQPGLSQIGQNEVQAKREDARRWIAQALVGMLAILVVVGCWGWIAYGNDVDRMQNFAILFSPVVTLLGTVLGFYFSSADKR